MAITYIVTVAGVYVAYGLSTDVKPESPPANAMFNETDTAKTYRVVGGVWTLNTDSQYSAWPSVTGNANKKLSVKGDASGVEWVTVAGGEAFPVGSVYIAVVATNPATLLGYGTWSAFATGRTIVGIDAGQTEFDAVEETGGAKTHTLTSAEMPAHTHTQDAHSHVLTQLRDATTGGATTNIALTADTSSTLGTKVTGSTTATNQNTGGGGAHNNLQPYITVYMWKRTS